MMKRVHPRAARFARFARFAPSAVSAVSVLVAPLAALVTLAGCAAPALEPPAEAAPLAAARDGGTSAVPATADEAKAFMARYDQEVRPVVVDQSRADWIQSTYITEDTEAMSSRAQEALMAYNQEAIKATTRFDGLKLDPDTARQIHLLRVSQTLPAPSDRAKRAELASTATRMTSLYGKGKACDAKGKCRDLEALSKVLATSRSWDEQLEAWRGWHQIARPMRPIYERYVELGNEGAREIGFKNLAELWRAGYDMSPDEFERETDRLWDQVRPLYQSLHCYVRARLADKYGAAKVPPNGPIPAHILGNMWAQEWSNIYPLVEPYKGASDIDVTRALQKKKYKPTDLVKLGESFFTSLGLDPLPKTFWERSMFVKPRDREVVCHASAWDITYDDDLRVKMCINVDEENLITIHHELGHDYYFHAYHQLPILYQAGANDGFHEGIGDTLALSVTPGYLKKLGILASAKNDDKALINLQLKNALDKVAFLPFGKLIDQWRWDVFSGRTTPAQYNAAWWALRLKYQGVAPPEPRTEEDFDPGAKYHVPANVPYTRYFLARLLQFQFHRALCKVSGFNGPLHECSIYGNKEAGARLEAMLALGASKPWPEALKAISGETQIDATAMLDYFAPLRAWLDKENAGRTCGW